jgi:hypothetical protein
VITKIFISLVATLVIVTTGALSQESLQEFERARQFEQALAAVDAIKHRKKLQCVLSIANGTLCECLSRKLPVDTYFRSYASITNQESEYVQLTAADKTIVDQCMNDKQ